jgi:C1A family cysteine protease
MARKKSSTRSLVKKGDFVIDHTTNNDLLFDPVVDGERKGRGLVPRDYSKFPQEMFAAPSEMKLIPRSEWDDRINEQEEQQSSLQHIRDRGDAGKPIPSLDQAQRGYCWAHSTTMATIIARARDNQPYVRLSAYAVACVIKNYRDQGGWCGESAQFLRERGVPSTQFWPEKSVARANDNPKTWENAALHKTTEDWVDLTRPIYGQNLTYDQIATCLLNNIPVAVDYNEWGHSICALRWTRLEAGVYVPLIVNSWTDGWGKNGTGFINRKWDVDGAVAYREVVAAAA